MPTPEIINYIFLAFIFFLLFGAFKHKILLPSAYLFIIVMKPGLYYPFLNNIRFQLIITIIILLSIFKSTQKEKLLSLDRSKILRYMFYFFLITTISMFQAFDFLRSWNRMYDQILPNFLLVVQLLLFCKNEKDIKIFLIILGISRLWLGYEPLYKYLTGDVWDAGYGAIAFDYATGSHGIARYHTSLAHNLIDAIPFFIYLMLLCQNKFGKMIYALIVSYFCYGVLISGSRGGFLGLLFALGLIALCSKHKILLFTFFGGLLIIIIPTLGSSYLSRMASLLQGIDAGLSASSRLDGLVHGIEMMFNRPILGVGPGCYPVVRKAWFNWSLWSHNHYGQLAGELGLTGIFVWFLFAREYIKKCYELSSSVLNEPWIKLIATAIFVVTLTRLVLGMADHSIFKYIWYIMAVLVIVMDEIYNAEKQKLYSQ